MVRVFYNDTSIHTKERGNSEEWAGFRRLPGRIGCFCEVGPDSREVGYRPDYRHDNRNSVTSFGKVILRDSLTLPSGGGGPGGGVYMPGPVERPVGV